MARSSKRDKPSQETVDEALRIARANQRPGQTKEQTRLIAQGIQKGIDQYKKQQKAKARELDKQKKRSAAAKTPEVSPEESGAQTDDTRGQAKLPWILLLLSWLGFGIYFVLSH